MPALEQDAAVALLVACPLLVACAVPVPPALPVLAGAVALLELMLEQPASSPSPTAAAAASVLCRIVFSPPRRADRSARQPSSSNYGGPRDHEEPANIYPIKLVVIIDKDAA